MKPEAYPYRLEIVWEDDARSYAHDLTGDGLDEIISLDPLMPAHVDHGILNIVSQKTGHIEQLNFPGKVGEPIFLDLNFDGISEIAAAFERNDSLFVTFANGEGEKLFSFFLANGKPRNEDGGVLAWDPAIIHCYLSDVNHDGAAELITILFTAYARLPRGVYIHSLPGGRLLGKSIVGAAIQESFLDDFDGDGQAEVIAVSHATNNGASFGGFNDAKSYIINFGLSIPPVINWAKEEGGVWSATFLFYEDLDRDRKREFIEFKYNRSNKERLLTKLAIIEPNSWRAVRERIINERIESVCIVDLNRDLVPEIIAATSNREIWVFDDKLDVINKKELPVQLNFIYTLPDIDGDGIDEIIGSTFSSILFFTPSFEVKGILPMKGLKFPRNTKANLLHRGAGVMPYIILNGFKKTIHISLKRNPNFIFYRYGPVALGGTGFLGAVWLSILIARRRRRNLSPCLPA